MLYFLDSGGAETLCSCSFSRRARGGVLEIEMHAWSSALFTSFLGSYRFMLIFSFIDTYQYLLLFSYDISSLRSSLYPIRLPLELTEAKHNLTLLFVFVVTRRLASLTSTQTDPTLLAGAVDNTPALGPDRGHPDSSLSCVPFSFSHAADSC